MLKLLLELFSGTSWSRLGTGSWSSMITGNMYIGPGTKKDGENGIGPVLALKKCLEQRLNIF